MRVQDVISQVKAQGLKRPFVRRQTYGLPLQRRKHSRVLRAIVVAALAAGLTHATEWRVGVVGAGVGGRYSSFRIDKSGNVHACSVSPANTMLTYSFWDSTRDKWFSMEIGKSSGFCSLVLDSKEHPHISFIGYGTNLNYARWNGNAWEKQHIPIRARTIAYNTSIALDAQDHPSISFYEELGQDDNKLRLRIVRWEDGYWKSSTIDSDYGSGKFNSMAIDSAGRPQVAYGNVSYENAGLRFASWLGQSWKLEILEGAGKVGTSMYSVALTLDEKDTPHITYTDLKNQLVKYGVKRAGKWDLEVVDKITKVGYPDRNGIAVDEDGNVYISYHDFGLGLLKVAYKRDGKWYSEIVDTQSGFTSCVRVAGKSVWVTYSDDSGEELRYAHAIFPSASGRGSGARLGETREGNEPIAKNGGKK
jgi:hypothetical protein